MIIQLKDNTQNGERTSCLLKAIEWFVTCKDSKDLIYIYVFNLEPRDSSRETENSDHLALNIFMKR